MSHSIHIARVLLTPPREEGRFLPEGPRRVTVSGRPATAWVNIQTAVESKHGEVHLLFDDGEHRFLQQPARPGFLIPTNKPDTVVVGMEKEVGTLNLATNEWTAWATIPDPSPRTIINDGEPTPDGDAVVFGTKDLKFAEPLGHLYLLTIADQKVSVLADKQTCSNGKFFERSAGGLLMYDIDTPKRNIVRYRLDLAARKLHPEGEVLDAKMFDGFPDGMVDAGEGTALVAFYNPHRGGDGQAFRVRLADGSVLHEWVTPGSPRVTCPLLYKAGNRTKLILTTATEGMPAELRTDSSDAGAIFAEEVEWSAVPKAGAVQLS